MSAPRGRIDTAARVRGWKCRPIGKEVLKYVEPIADIDRLVIVGVGGELTEG